MAIFIFSMIFYLCISISYAQEIDMQGGVPQADGSISYPAIDKDGNVGVHIVQPSQPGVVSAKKIENVKAEDSKKSPKCFVDNQKGCGDEENSSLSKKEPQVSTKASVQCQSAFQKTSRCSVAPGVSVGVAHDNILGNYDVVSGQARQNSKVLHHFVSQCQSLMKSCSLVCSTTSPDDKALASQCFKYQGVISMSRKEVQNLEGLLQEAQEAAERIRSGESAIKKQANHGRGRGLSDKKPKSKKSRAGFKKDLRNEKDDFFKTSSKVTSSQKEEIDHLKGVAAREPEVLQKTELSNVSQLLKSADGQKQLGLEKDKKWKSHFEKVSAKLFNGFVSSKKRRREAGLDSVILGQGELLSTEKSLISSEDILKKRWEEGESLRGVASKEAGRAPSNAFIFHSMCLDYKTYEVRNEIHEGQTQCPSKNP